MGTCAAGVLGLVGAVGAVGVVGAVAGGSGGSGGRGGSGGKGKRGALGSSEEKVIEKYLALRRFHSFRNGHCATRATLAWEHVERPAPVGMVVLGHLHLLRREGARVASRGLALNGVG